MSKAKQKTIADIVAEMRNEGHAGDESCLEWVGAKIRGYADRIEAAAKREREAGAEAAQICGEIGEMIGREAACKQSVTDCNHLGNAAELRKENARLRAALKPVLDISIDMNTSDLAMSMAIKEAKRIYNEGRESEVK